MTSSAAFRCVQAWLLEKPAAWADEDAPCLAAALMAQRPPYERPREDALLEAERSHQRHLIAQLDEELLDETQRREDRELDNKILRWQLDRCNEFLKQTRKRAARAEVSVEELLLDETLRREERDKNSDLRRRVGGLNDIIDRDRKRARERVEELERSNIRQRVERLDEILE